MGFNVHTSFITNELEILRKMWKFSLNTFSGLWSDWGDSPPISFKTTHISLKIFKRKLRQQLIVDNNVICCTITQTRCMTSWFCMTSSLILEKLHIVNKILDLLLIHINIFWFRLYFPCRKIVYTHENSMIVVRLLLIISH